MTNSLDTIPRHLEMMLADCERNRRRLKKKLKDLPDPEKGVRMMKDLTLSSVQLSRETRAWVKEKKELGKTLTIAEQMDLAVSFIAGLSRADRRELMARLEGYREVG